MQALEAQILSEIALTEKAVLESEAESFEVMEFLFLLTDGCCFGLFFFLLFQYLLFLFFKPICIREL